MASMLEFRTPGFNPYAVKYSPYYDSRLAVAASANYGIVGNGRLFALGLGPTGIQLEKAFETNDALYDLAWSEINENQLVVACGDGSIKLFDLAAGDFPLMNFAEHKREAFSVCWNPIAKDSFISSSWDGTIKIWSPSRPTSLKTLPVGCCTYSACFSPTNPAIISSVSSDSHIRIFDLRTPVSAKYHLTNTIPAHAAPQDPGLSNGQAALASSAPAEILTHDWNKYRDTVIATGGVDRVVRTFDIRNPAGGPLSVLLGHGYAVRRLAWSPHASDVLATASYDMTVRVWSDGSMGVAAPQPNGGGQTPVAGVGTQLGVMNRHSEFVTGVDWCLFGTGGWLASAGWDQRVLVWDAHTLLRG
ncbi:WD40-repeat-containing domain protein [Achaetomium macrosporum]|uniref:Peroxin-7 n=1 Tax=Achaetomium macrosporum TaxID=79813 RepID=A0AAN7HDC3_9PEZI|nr:WD40-repeat-containing domain protein [Achaetomium macrosporum]